MRSENQVESASVINREKNTPELWKGNEHFFKLKFEDSCSQIIQILPLFFAFQLQS